MVQRSRKTVPQAWFIPGEILYKTPMGMGEWYGSLVDTLISVGFREPAVRRKWKTVGHPDWSVPLPLLSMTF